jgi:cytoskeletal protein CcmA (bactofilin family)
MGKVRKRRHPEDGRAPDQATEGAIGEVLGPEITVVSQGTELEGTLVSAESIRIDGRAKGRIAARGDVILSSDSEVEADIHAQNVVIGGRLKGNITALARTELAQGGRAEGTIRSKVLVVQDGALFIGESRIGEHGPGERRGSGYPEDRLWTAYQEATRRTAEWYRSRLGDAIAEPDRAQTEAGMGALEAGAGATPVDGPRSFLRGAPPASIDRAARIDGDGGGATSPLKPGSSARLDEPLLNR